ncbi:MAG: glycosyltransferase family 4 protein [Candidatus Omnitrophica bacterium]|nr:glycosyltransferase family 4 protein [Candidatus Omnitrophota bacterium]MDD5518359.1 glycosyltransferase family 4 protein [Candidatus Omnitrophota bacterium]
MKILMLHPHDIFSYAEPWTIRIVSLAQEFRDNGHQVKLAYCPLGANKEKRRMDLEGVEIITLSRRVGVNNLFSNLLKIKKASRWADIIHFQKYFHYISIPALLCSWYLNKPIHYDWDDWEEKIWQHSNKKSIHSFIFGWFIRLLETYIPKLVDTISVSSCKLGQICLDSGVARDRIFHVPVGADLKKFGPHISGKRIREECGLDGKPLIMYIGQLHSGQYTQILLEAANIVLHHYPEARFLIIGKGYMLSQLRELVRQRGVKERVVFTDSIAYEFIPEYIAAADICVAPFEDNAITICKSPLKVAEYLASGKPIVASLVGEIRNMAGGAGLLVKPGNHIALAEGIISLLKDDKLREKMGLISRRRAEDKYNWPHAAGEILKAYKKALNL